MSITIKMRVESYDVQPNGNIKMSSLLKFLQKAAGDDVNKTPLGYYSLAQNNMAFVLVKMNIKILRDIKLYDELTIISHPRNVRGVSFPRDYIVKIEDMPVAYIRSIWALLDLEKRTVLRPSAISDIGDLPPCEDDGFEIEDIRLNINPASLSRTNVQSVDYYHLDMNNHLNNTFYSDFIFNLIDRQAHPTDAGLYMQINYKAEARLGDELVIRFDSDKNEYNFVADNLTNNKTCFSAFLRFDS